eukprot:XP_001699810.1 predicted protein [Chlamydomonas reinhardtii]
MAALLMLIWTAPAASLLSYYGLTCGREWYVSLLNSLYFVGLAVVLVTELVGPDYRGRVGILTQSFFIAGECLLALLAAFVRDWRLLTLLLYVSFFLISIAEAPSSLVVGLLIDRVGRCGLVLAGMAVSGLACIACGLAEGAPLAQVLFAMLGKFGCSGAWSVLVVYCAEVFPTSHKTHERPEGGRGEGRHAASQLVACLMC